MLESDKYGVQASVAMGEFYRARSAYRTHKTKRGRERLDAKARKVSEFMRKSLEAAKKEGKWA